MRRRESRMTGDTDEVVDGPIDLFEGRVDLLLAGKRK